MKINLSPQRRDDTLSVSKIADTLFIDGGIYDFSPLPEGATLPREAIDCPWIIGDVTRVNGEIELTLILPNGPNASHAARFPDYLTVTQDGVVELPA